MGKLEAYGVLLGEIKQRIQSAQYEALRAVNRELIALYWDIGHLIVTRQEGETWGKSVVATLAKDLSAKFPRISGFFSLQPLADEAFLRDIPRFRKTRTTGARSWLEPQLGHRQQIWDFCKELNEGSGFEALFWPSGPSIMRLLKSFLHH